MVGPLAEHNPFAVGGPARRALKRDVREGGAATPCPRRRWSEDPQRPYGIHPGAEERNPCPSGEKVGAAEHDVVGSSSKIPLGDDRGRRLGRRDPHPDLVLPGAIGDMREQPAVRRPHRVRLVPGRLENRARGPRPAGSPRRRSRSRLSYRRRHRLCGQSKGTPRRPACS